MVDVIVALQLSIRSSIEPARTTLRLIDISWPAMPRSGELVEVTRSGLEADVRRVTHRVHECPVVELETWVGEELEAILEELEKDHWQPLPAAS